MGRVHGRKVLLLLPQCQTRLLEIQVLGRTNQGMALDLLESHNTKVIRRH